MTPFCSDKKANRIVICWTMFFMLFEHSVFSIVFAYDKYLLIPKFTGITLAIYSQIRYYIFL